VLLNTSRGEVVDGAALLAALEGGGLGGAALDVVGGERQGAGAMVDHPLISYAARHANLLITPHIGGATWDSMRRTEIFMAEKLRAWAVRNGFDVGGAAPSI
ncbi:MAG: NAD(P)-dependent oxidoreductase, partial [Hyphomicrobium sp.]